MNKLTDEQHREFMDKLDGGIKRYVEDIEAHREKWSGDTIEEIIRQCMLKTSRVRYNKDLPIEFVRENNIPINEFYSSDLLFHTLITYCLYTEHKLMCGVTLEDDESSLYKVCRDLGFITYYTKGINLVDDVIYILMEDCEFVKYKVGVMDFGVSPLKL